MASALDILNSLDEPVEDILEEENYNFNTDAFNDPAEMPLEPYNPNIGEIGFGIPGSGEGLELLYNTAKDLFNRGFITEIPADANVNTGAYQTMVPDERNVLQELPEILSDLEYKKIIANSVLNTPDMLLDMLSTGIQLGSDVITGYKNNDILSGLDLGFFEENVIMPEIDELQYDDKFAEGEKALEATGAGIMAFPLYKYLKGKLPKIAQKALAAYAPYTDKVATSKNAGNFIKNLFTGLGGRTIPQLLGTTGLTAGLGTLFYSGPAYGALDDPGGMNYQDSSNNFTYNPNANINTGIQNSDPVIFDSYMQDKIDNFEPRPKAPGPRNNYQGM